MAGRRRRQRRPPRLGLRAALRSRSRLPRLPDSGRAHAVSVANPFTSEASSRREEAGDAPPLTNINKCLLITEGSPLLLRTKRNRDDSCPVVWYVLDGWATSETAHGGTPFLSSSSFVSRSRPFSFPNSVWERQTPETPFR